MEEVQNEMRENSNKKYALARARAGEKAMKHPQLMDNNEIIPTDPKGLPSGGSNEAGLRRVIGRKKGGAKKAAAPELVVQECHSSDSSDGEAAEGGARHQGRMLAEHIAKLHGAGYAKRFLRGMTRHGGAKQIETPMGFEVEHAVSDMAQVPPGGRPALAYGSAPQAPASFARNTVGMGMPEPSVKAAKMRAKAMKGGSNGRMVGAGLETTSTNLPSAQIGNGGKRAARGAAISKLMKEHGMTLGEASRHLKEHGSA
jgi:hypothetical protein